MKIVCTQENLLAGIQVVGRSVGKDSDLQVLSNILFEVKDGRIKLAATNLEIGVSCFIRGKIEKEGRITVPAKLLVDYVSTLPKSKVVIELLKDTVRVSCNKYKADFKGISAEEFPLIPKTSDDLFCSLKGDQLKESLTQVVFAAAMDESRPEIAGVYFYLEEKKIKLVATDSYRLAEKIVDFSEVGKEERGMIVPVRAVGELLRVLGSKPEEVTVSLGENQVFFSFESKVLGSEVQLVSRLIEGRFPDYKQIIPNGFETTVKFNVDTFVEGLKAASIFSRVGISDVFVKVYSKKNEIVVESESKEAGSGSATVKGKVDGDDKEIVFNYRYMLDGLSNVGSGEVELLLNNEGPGVLRLSGKEDYTYVIMPIEK